MENRATMKEVREVLAEYTVAELDFTTREIVCQVNALIATREGPRRFVSLVSVRKHLTALARRDRIDRLADDLWTL